MPKFVIEREMPGVGGLSAEQLREAAALSSKVVAELSPDIHWLTSFVTTDKVYCVFVAADEDVVLEHARCAGLPADRISRVTAAIDASTGE